MPNSIIPHISRPLHPHILLAIIILLSFAAPVSPLVLQNTTIALPKGSSDHNTPGLLCTPTRPIDLLIFYLLNYVAHAATVLTRPGERADDYLTSVFGSLLFPALGLYRGIEAILCGAVWVRNDDLRKAARSGALCVVVRDAEWRPRAGDEIGDVILRRAGGRREESAKKTEDDSVEMATEKGEGEREGANQDKDKTIHILPFSPPYLFARFGWPVFVHRRIIHGTHSLPQGYSFAILPHDTAFLAPSPSSPQDVPSPQPQASTLSLTSTHNMVKATIALAQSAYALTTLYRARGDQIAQFGFAAFGLTVAPYAVMSIVNLLGNLCRPEYASLYMVESGVMDEARGRGGVFEGSVARVREEGGGGVDVACGFGGGEEVRGVRFCGGDDGDGEVRVRFRRPFKDGARHIPSEMGARDAKNPFEPSYREVVPDMDSDSKTLDSPLSITTTITTSSSSSSSSTSPPSSLHSNKHSYAIAPVLKRPNGSSARHSALSYAIAPVPKGLNYISTRDSALLLVPCHAPICRTGTSSSVSSSSVSTSASSGTDSESPTQQTLTSLTLERTFPFIAHYTYKFIYAPSRSASVSRRWRWAKYLLTTFIALLPVLITGTMSRFQAGSIPKTEASTWRVFTMQWLTFGVFTGMWWVLDQECKDAMPSIAAQVKPISRGVAYLVSASPAVGGYVVVGQMLYRYGVCMWVGD